MRKNYALQVATGGIIAGLYIVITILVAPIASGPIQTRISEALTILPIFTPMAIPGLTIGCVLANLFTGCVLEDIIFGSLATLIGAFGTRLLRKHPYLAWIPPVVSNMVIVPIVLLKAYHVEEAWWYLVLTIGIGEIISCGILGLLLYQAVRKLPEKLTGNIFPDMER